MLHDPKWQNRIETWRGVLLRAASIVRDRGLAKHAQQDKEGRVCLHGAINVALTGVASMGTSSDLHRKAAENVYRYLLQHGVSPDLIRPTGVASWNNQPARTPDEVIAALEGAATSIVI